MEKNQAAVESRRMVIHGDKHTEILLKTLTWVQRRFTDNANLQLYGHMRFLKTLKEIDC